jgi:hypothetical protein
MCPRMMFVISESIKSYLISRLFNVPPISSGLVDEHHRHCASSLDIPSGRFVVALLPQFSGRFFGHERIE